MLQVFLAVALASDVSSMFGEPRTISLAEIENAGCDVAGAYRTANVLGPSMFWFRCSQKRRALLVCLEKRDGILFIGLEHCKWVKEQ
jgi:hypothetical protein